MTYIDEVFGHGGVLDEHLDNYEVRPGQIELARALDRAIEARRPLVAEGPTGSGKGISYLVPSIYHSAVNHIGRVVIVTANIALQGQLVQKDLPFLREALPWPFTFGLAKGRSNYICAYAYQKLIERLSFNSKGGLLPHSGQELNLDHGGRLLPESKQRFRPAQLEQIRLLLPWVSETGTGDKSDLEFDASEAWHFFSSSSDNCLGQSCPFAEPCLANRARKRAMSADVVVMNYHLRFVGRGVMTPEHAILVCDEAHKTASIARDFFGWTLTVNRINWIASWLREHKEASFANRLWSTGSSFFLHIAEMLDEQSTLRLYNAGWAVVDELVDCLKLADKIASEFVEEAQASLSHYMAEDRREQLKIESARAEKIAENALMLAFQCRAAVDLSLEGWVFWLAQERKHQRYTVEARPIEVADTISDILFPAATHSVMLISATMTSGGNFNFVRGELSVPEEAEEIVAPSPFDLREQGLLLIPREMSPPPTYGDRQSELAFQNDVCFYSDELIKMCGGRALLLFSSWKNLNYVHDYLSESSACKGLTLLKQGEKPRMRLLAEFKEDETSVLLGVDSFWTGVDIPGRSLTGLLIDKIPFGSPSDPVNKAIAELLQSLGRSVFLERVMPEATIKLRQGSGRLIRTRSDVGIVFILDTRLLITGYGDTIVSSLPGFIKVRSLEKAQLLAERLLGRL